jgi:hypothetical protein
VPADGFNTDPPAAAQFVWEPPIMERAAWQDESLSVRQKNAESFFLTFINNLIIYPIKNIITFVSTLSAAL